MARVHLYVAAACAVVLALAAPSLAGDPDMLQDICVADKNRLAERVPVQGERDGGRLLLRRAQEPRQHQQPERRRGDGGERGQVRRREHSWRVLGAHRLRPGGLNPPHTHPRATEIIFVIEGVLEVGFITTADKLFSKIITKGDVFVFPRGLVHFQQNRGHGPATVIAGFNSQLQGTQQVAMTLFGATPPVSSDILAKAFRIDNRLVDAIKARF
ncbi:hypothetical protein EJB05_32448, partial [Eragrostis curvula]